MKPAILRSASDNLLILFCTPLGLIFVCRNRDDTFSFLWLKVSTVVSNGSREMNLFDPFIGMIWSTVDYEKGCAFEQRQ